MLAASGFDQQILNCGDKVFGLEGLSQDTSGKKGPPQSLDFSCWYYPDLTSDPTLRLVSGVKLTLVRWTAMFRV
jgi:hypothetical protein